MKKHFQYYLKSFKLKKEHAYTFLIDSGVVALIAGIVFLFFNTLKTKALSLSQGQTPQQLQQMIAKMQTDQIALFATNLKSFMLLFAIGSVVILLAALFLFSLSRKMIWDHLTKHKTKYWKWNLINIVLLLPILLFLLLAGLVIVLGGSLVSLLGSNDVLSVYYFLLRSLVFAVTVVFIFLTYYNFHKTYKTWESVGKTFSMIKDKWKVVWPTSLFILSIIIIISIIFSQIVKLLMYQSTVLTVVSVLISLLFLSWTRFYLYRMIKE